MNSNSTNINNGVYKGVEQFTCNHAAPRAWQYLPRPPACDPEGTSSPSLERDVRWCRITSRSWPCPILARTRTLTFIMCSTALGSVPEPLDRCMPGRAVSRDEQTSEAPQLSLWPLVFLILWSGRTHVHVLPVSSSLEILCALMPFLTSCCIWEKQGENPELWVKVLPTAPYLKCTQEGWAVAYS